MNKATQKGSLLPALGWKTTPEEEAKYRRAIASAEEYMASQHPPRIDLPDDMRRQDREEENQYYFEP